MPVYFKITVYDGEPRVKVYQEKALLAELNDGDYENVEFLKLEDLEGNPDPNFWPSEGDGPPILIIKGEVVVPQEKSKVTEWTFKKEK